MTKMGVLRDFQGVIRRFLREFANIAGFIIYFDYKIAEKSLGYLCTERDFWGVYRGFLGDLRMRKPRAGVAVYILLLQYGKGNMYHLRDSYGFQKLGTFD